ncbi:MAG: glycosyltransferase [Candidatus Eisenbacteria sp.]|nr:glycosyltransferase [Candidatus Eisenbacteria bacterium]
MKILLLLPALVRGGAERVAIELAGQWKEKHDVLLATLWEHYPRYDSPVPVRSLGNNLPRSFCGRIASATRRIWQLRGLFLQEQPDAIVSFLEAASLPAVLAARLAGMHTRLVVTVRNDFRTHRPAIRLLMRLLYPGVRTAAPSRQLVELLIAARIARVSRARVLPNPLIVPRVEDTCPPELPQSYILGMGRLVPQKDFPLLIRAYASALEKAQLPDLVIAGEGPDKEPLLALTRRLGLGSRVFFPGFVEDTPTLLRRAELFVLTSRHEGWPQVLMQALAAGCPAISVDCDTGPREILENGTFGLLLRERTPHAVADAILRAMGNRQFREEMRRAGPRRAASFKARLVAAEWVSALRSPDWDSDAAQ